MYKQNQFINELWLNNPKLAEKIIKTIMMFDDKFMGDFNFECCEGNYLRFSITRFDGENKTYVWVSDYEFIWRETKAVKGFHEDTKWMRVMYAMYAKEYMQGFLVYRDNMFAKEMKEYKKRFNHQTENILNELDIDIEDIQGQTK